MFFRTPKQLRPKRISTPGVPQYIPPADGPFDVPVTLLEDSDPDFTKSDFAEPEEKDEQNHEIKSHPSIIHSQEVFITTDGEKESQQETKKPARKNKKKVQQALEDKHFAELKSVVSDKHRFEAPLLGIFAEYKGFSDDDDSDTNSSEDEAEHNNNEEMPHAHDAHDEHIAHNAHQSSPFKKFCFAVFTGSLVLNSINELTDAGVKTRGKINLFPFPGNSLAYIPNNYATITIGGLALAGYTIMFDYPQLEHGANSVLSAGKRRELPIEWVDAWKKNRYPIESLHRLIKRCILISALAVANEVISNLKVAKDNSAFEDPEEAEKTPYWFRFPMPLVIASAYVGNIPYFFCEAFKLPSVVVQLKCGLRGLEVETINRSTGKKETQFQPYSGLAEVLTLPLRVAGTIGPALFSLSALISDNDDPNINSLWAQMLLFSLFNIHKGLTALAYDGEYTLQSLCRATNAATEIMKHLRSLCRASNEMSDKGNPPSFGEGVAFSLAISLSGFVAALQHTLILFYFDNLLNKIDLSESAKEDINQYFLEPLALVWAYQMWCNYTGSLNDLFVDLGIKARSAYETHCGGGQPPHYPPAEIKTDVADDASGIPYHLLPDEKRAPLPPSPSELPAPQVNRSTPIPGKSGLLDRAATWCAEKSTTLRSRLCGKRPSEEIAEEQFTEEKTKTTPKTSPKSCAAEPPASTQLRASEIKRPDDSTLSRPHAPILKTGATTSFIIDMPAKNPPQTTSTVIVPPSSHLNERREEPKNNIIWASQFAPKPSLVPSTQTQECPQITPPRQTAQV